eukprot:3900925-Alexandrium_andersonii.AAC.1
MSATPPTMTLAGGNSGATICDATHWHGTCVIHRPLLKVTQQYLNNSVLYDTKELSLPGGNH